MFEQIGAALAEAPAAPVAARTVQNGVMQQMLGMLAGYNTTRQIDQFKLLLWQRLWKRAGGELDDEAVQTLAEAADVRRKELSAAREKRQPPVRSYFPIREKSERTRQQAASGTRDPERWARKQRLGGLAALPPAEEYKGFTEGERAALYIVAADVRETGACRCTVAEIADRAGVGQTTVRNAVRKARARELLCVEHRPQWRDKWLSNVITIICKTWLGWLRRFRPNLGFKGVKKPASTDTYRKNNINGRPFRQPEGGPTGRFQRFASRKPPSG